VVADEVAGRRGKSASAPQTRNDFFIGWVRGGYSSRLLR
jgi:hypothetical protein